MPIEQVSSLEGDPLQLSSARLDLRHFERREGEVLLRADVLGHRLIDVPNARLVRAADLELTRDGEEWVVSGVDTRRRPRRLFGLLGPEAPDDAGVFRDWHDFEWLIGHAGSALLRGPFARIRRLKPAQIADLLEEASKEEETEILGRVHADPELEADVFEELDEDLATRLLGARTEPGDRRRAGPDARRRRRGRDRRTAPAAQAARPGPAAARPADQGADPDGLQRHQRGRPDGGGLRRLARHEQRRRRAGPGPRVRLAPARGADQRPRRRRRRRAARRGPAGHPGPVRSGRDA